MQFKPFSLYPYFRDSSVEIHFKMQPLLLKVPHQQTRFYDPVNALLDPKGSTQSANLQTPRQLRDLYCTYFLVPSSISIRLNLQLQLVMSCALLLLLTLYETHPQPLGQSSHSPNPLVFPLITRLCWFCHMTMETSSSLEARFLWEKIPSLHSPIPVCLVFPPSCSGPTWHLGH